MTREGGCRLFSARLSSVGRRLDPPCCNNAFQRGSPWRFLRSKSVRKVGRAGVALPVGALQPFERVILVIPIPVNVGDLVGSGFAVFGDQLSQCRIGFGDAFLTPASGTHDEEPCPARPHPFARPRSLLQVYLPKDNTSRHWHRNLGPTDSIQSPARIPPALLRSALTTPDWTRETPGPGHSPGPPRPLGERIPGPALVSPRTAARFPASMSSAGSSGARARALRKVSAAPFQL